MTNTNDNKGVDMAVDEKKKLHRQNYKLFIINLIVLILVSIRPGYPLEMVYHMAVPVFADFGDYLSSLGTEIKDSVATGRDTIDAMNEADLDDSVHENSYAYKTLDYDTKRVYIELYDTIMSFAESTTVSTTSDEVLSNAYDALTADHGELFWIKGYSCRTHTRRSEVIQLDFLPLYTMDESTRDYFQQKVDAAVTRILDNAPFTGTDYEKAKYVFDYLASNIEYERESDENQNILSVFLYERSVCQGFASATQYLLRELGVQSAIVTGLSNNVPHAWNLVVLDDEYYYMDTTWGNSTFTDENVHFVDYSYFAVTSAECDLTHKADVTFPLPSCRATVDNYYVQEGLLFSSFDEQVVIDACLKQLEDTGVASIKFASDDVYKTAANRLLRDGGIAEVCSSSIYYVDNAALRILTFKVDSE